MASDTFRNLISGQTRGIGAVCQRGGLRVLSWGYGGGVWLRNRLFDCGLKRVHAPPVPAVAVGNITAGGTGKTPVVAYVANWFAAKNRTPAILSRGYKSLDSGDNDEKLVLDRLCPGIPHLQNPDRVAAARQAVEQHGSQVLVLDDAFQHRRIGRSLNLCLIDATNPWGYGHLLPRGLLREPLRELTRADLFIITRADQVSAGAIEAIRGILGRWAPGVPHVVSRFTPTGWLTLSGEKLPLNAFAGQTPFAFCGIGNPDGFTRTLAAAGYDLAARVPLAFPDHHAYTPADCGVLASLARDNNAGILFTTLKDLVKLPLEEFRDLTVAALLIDFEILEGGEVLEERLQSLIEDG